MPNEGKYKILFVCTGNTCRSPMAEYLFRHMLLKAGKTHVEVDSAGVSPATWLDFPSEARQVLSGEGIKDIDHQPKGITDDLVSSFDLILVMEPNHQEHMRREFPEIATRVHLLQTFADPEHPGKGISDPFGQGLSAYNKAFKEIKEALNKIYHKIPEE